MACECELSDLWRFSEVFGEGFAYPDVSPGLESGSRFLLTTALPDRREIMIAAAILITAGQS